MLLVEQQMTRDGVDTDSMLELCKDLKQLIELTEGASFFYSRTPQTPYVCYSNCTIDGVCLLAHSKPASGVLLTKLISPHLHREFIGSEEAETTVNAPQ